MTAATRVLIVDDHSGFRASARTLLETAGYAVCGEAPDAASAIEATRSMHPDVLLLDIQLPDADGFAVADAIGAMPGAHPRVVLVSSREAADYGSRLDRSDTDGFICKADLSADRLHELLDPPAPRPTQERLRVVIADDSYLLREGLQGLLTSRGIEVAGLAGTVDELLREVVAANPDAAIVDIRMPPTGTDEGLRAADMLAVQQPGVGVLILSDYLEPEYANRLFKGGTPGRGYLLKESVTDLDGFVETIERIVAGESVLDPTIVSELVAMQRADEPLHELSEREREILQLVAQGRTNRGIAERLSVSERTIESHISRTLMKLGIADGPDDHRRVLAVLAYLGR